MRPQALPIDFVLKNGPLTWREAQWGYERQWLGWASAVDLAAAKLAAHATNHPLEVELAGLQKANAGEAGDLIRQLAETEPAVPDEVLKRKWLFLVLSWLFENRAQFPDLLGLLGEIYGDFDYPDEIQRFLGFMPISGVYDPNLHIGLENRTWLITRWREYLEAAGGKFGASKSEA
jgi:hypothetical protein